VSEPQQTINKETFLSLEHPLQPRRFVLALFFALVLFPLIGAALALGTAVLIVPFFAFLLWLGGRVWFARFMGNSILVSELNYPRIHHISEELKSVIVFKKTVNVFVYEQGNFNAFLIKFFFYRRAVFLNSELLEAGVTDDELRWIIGRFIGYLRARRQAGFWGWTIRAAQQLGFFNVFLLPYERALVYTGDRIALAVINGDISSAISAMQKIFVGRQLGYSVNPNGIVDQHRLVKGSFFAWFARLPIGFPHLTARYVDMIIFGKQRYPEQYARFEAENPGLPADLEKLAALPFAKVSKVPKKDPWWPSLVAAVVVLALLTLLTIKVIIPFAKRMDQHGELPFTPADATDFSSTPTATTSTPTTTTPTDTPVSAPSVQPFVSDDGRFSVLFPGTPTETQNSAPLSGTDTLVIHQFQYDASSSLSYLVIYNDYPANYSFGDTQPALGRIRDASATALKATVTSDGPVDLNGVPGRAFVLTDNAGNTFYGREYLNGQRLYRLFVTVGAGGSSSSADDFLNSFHIQ
jgi:hypothetical protein